MFPDCCPRLRRARDRRAAHRSLKHRRSDIEMVSRVKIRWAGHIQKGLRQEWQELGEGWARTAYTAVNSDAQQAIVIFAYHLPAKCSVMIAIKRSMLPKIARWIMTGLDGGLSGFVASSGERYLRLNCLGSWKSSWMVAHWKDRRRASRIVISILGP